MPFPRPARRWLPLLALLSAAAAPAPGFDCAKATAPVETLICSDETLATLDREMAARFRAVQAAASAEGAPRLRDIQRAWLRGRDGCLKAPGVNDTAGQIACLTNAYQDRTTTFDSQFRPAGPLLLEQRLVKRRLTKQRVTETEAYPWLTGKPASLTEPFNRHVLDRLAVKQGLFAAAPIDVGPKPEGETTYDRWYEIHWTDQRLISVEVYTHHESFFGHGWRSEFALNWDLKTNRPIHVADLFKPDTAWHKAVLDEALSWLNDNADFGKPNEVLALADPEDDESWLFDDDGGVLLIGREERSMAGTSADVPIPYKVLAPFLRPDGPIPAGD